MSPPVVIADPRTERYTWIGAVTGKSFKVFLDVYEDEGDLFVSSNAQFDEDDWPYHARDATTPSPDVDTGTYGRLRQFHCGILKASTKYYVGLGRGSGSREILLVGSVTTFPESGASNEVYIALGSCQKFASDTKALEEIASWRKAVEESRPGTPFLMLHMGDLHYGDVRQNDAKVFEPLIRDVVVKGRELFRTTPVVATYDDHDYGHNNSGMDAPAREAALASHAAMIPKPAPDHVYHAFTVANVRIIVSDLRSEAGKDKVMSEEQMRFLTEEIRKSKNMDATIWVSSRPWIEPETLTSDRWGGYAKQRNELANFIATNDITNLIVVCGDAHMLAADDGSHSCYADKKYGTMGFPVLHSSPLANYGSVKGGPYSNGVVTKQLRMVRQYAILCIRPSNDNNNYDDATSPKRVEMEFSGFRVGKNVESPQLLLKKQPVIQLNMTSPFLTEATQNDNIGCVKQIKSCFSQCI